MSRIAGQPHHPTIAKRLSEAELWKATTYHQIGLLRGHIAALEAEIAQKDERINEAIADEKRDAEIRTRLEAEILLARKQMAVEILGSCQPITNTTWGGLSESYFVGYNDALAHLRKRIYLEFGIGEA